ncbi:serine hydrolase domain-containing protein [Sporosarcina sp. FA9]|uniref:serine hydrolase domain-containing protein n=1 Tax=Sporosarcina sp. FA9 TaxID=3413030 RepID=UPI003F656819
MSRWNEFEKFVEELMKKEQIPGVAVAVSENGKTIYESGFGKRSLATNEPITPETIFGIASVTKSFTALAIMKLVEERKLQVEDSVSKYLPNFRLIGYEKMENIKILHLLSHTTGLATTERIVELAGFEEHMDYINKKEWTVLGKPGEYFCYNNDMFLLLGAIIETVSGESYQEYIKTFILKPLDMNRTTYDLDELQNVENVTTPYVLENEKPVACLWPELGNYAVGGGIRSNVTDLLKYGQVYVDALENQIIGKKYSSEMAKHVHQVISDSFYGYALKSTPDYMGVTLVEHGGGQPGVSSNFGFVPEKGIVAVVLTNLSDVNADAIWLAAVNTALNIPIDEKRSVEPHYEITDAELRPMLGIYRSDEGAKIRILQQDTTMTAIVADKTFQLRASDKQTLVMLPIEKPIRFHFDENNKAWALSIGLRMLVKSTT